MTSKIGPHGIKTTPESVVWASRSAIAKGFGSTALLAAAHANAVRIYRHPFADQRLDAPAEDVANAILHGLEGYRHPLLYVEVYVGIPGSAWGQHAAFLERVVPILHAAGVGVAGPSWYTGDYEREAWEGFRARGWCGLDLIAFQAYWSTAGFTQWNALRYRQFWQPGDRKLVITECFRDQVRDGPNGTMLPHDGPGSYGFRSQGLTDEQALAELEAYDAELVKDDYVLGATPFTTGPTDDWRERGFDLNPLAAELARRSVPRSAPPVIVAPAPGPIPEVPPVSDLIAGIDVSNHQGDPDWDQVVLDPRRPRFAICKATEDDWGVDKTFSRNWSETARVGMGRGGYVYVRPNLWKPEQSVDLLERAIEGTTGLAHGGVIMADAEDGLIPGYAAWLLKWADLVERRLGKGPGLYTGPWFMDQAGLYDPALVERFWLWLAVWQNQPPQVPAPWQRYVLWQSGYGPCQGIAGNVDYDFFTEGTELPADLAAPSLPNPIPPIPLPSSYSFDERAVRGDFDDLWQQTEDLAHKGRRKARAVSMQRTIGRMKTDLKIA